MFLDLHSSITVAFHSSFNLGVMTPSPPLIFQLIIAELFVILIHVLRVEAATFEICL